MGFHGFKQAQFGAILTAFLAVSAWGASTTATAATPAANADLDLTSLEFTAKTNVSAVTVHGKSTEMKGQASFDAKGALAKVDATVPVDSLKTGMDMRDHHMRDRVFKTADGKYPDLQFTSSSVSCSGASQCKVTGPLTIRGIPKIAEFSCGMSAEAADCTATVKLSTYGIERPTQLGVTVVDAIPVHLIVKRK